jgi:hypothetical protein
MENFSANEKATTDIHVRVRGGIIQIPIEQPGITTVVPIRADDGNRAP